MEAAFLRQLNEAVFLVFHLIIPKSQLPSNETVTVYQISTDPEINVSAYVPDMTDYIISKMVVTNHM